MHIVNLDLNLEPSLPGSVAQLVDLCGVNESIHTHTQSLSSSGLIADEWIKKVAGVMGGKGGGNKMSAQASSPKVDKLLGALEAAREFAKLKLE